VGFLFDDESRLIIYPIAEYQAIWDAAENSRITNQMNVLKQLPAERVSQQSAPLPILSPSIGTNDVAVQVGYVDFVSGSGIRFIGREMAGQASKKFVRKHVYA